MKIDVRLHAVPKKGRDFSRTNSEDVCVYTDPAVRPFIAVVADGHGDVRTEVNVQTIQLARYVAHELCDQAGVPVQEVCANIQRRVAEKFCKIHSGAVATRIIVEEGRLHVAYLGDCRLYQWVPDASSWWQRFVNKLRGRLFPFVQITHDHHPNHPEEYARLFPLVYPQVKDPAFSFYPIDSTDPQQLAAFGGETTSGLNMRFLAVTRSFGDPDMRPIVISEPDEKTIAFDSSARHIFALCSDGGAEVVEKVFRLVRKWKYAGTLDNILLVLKAMTPQEPVDDTTILLIELTPDEV
ncbi:MAG: PP2C family protein-serine/threonine phosphatase [Candidatus Uhrbacteria bacterium]|nr:PP2C family protein-serine/threonine phosphatase [Candidatus Uhrbacteria bacterium]